MKRIPPWVPTNRKARYVLCELLNHGSREEREIADGETTVTKLVRAECLRGHIWLAPRA